MLQNRFILESVLPRSPSDSLHPSIGSSMTLKTVITIAGVDSQGSSPRYLNSGRSQGRASSNERETPPSTTGYARMSCTLHTPIMTNARQSG